MANDMEGGGGMVIRECREAFNIANIMLPDSLLTYDTGYLKKAHSVILVPV